MEHRWGKRVPLSIEVRLICGPFTSGSARIRDASMSGAFIATDLMPPPLAPVRIEVDHEPRDGRHRTTALVAHVVRRDHAGIAVEWSTLQPDFARLLAAPGRSAAGSAATVPQKSAIPA